MSLLIISPPRSGSSIIAQLLENAGLETDKIKENQVCINPSIFNKNGYNEDVCFTLLNDQIIRCIYGNEFSFIHAPHPLKIKELFVFKPSILLKNLMFLFLINLLLIFL